MRRTRRRRSALLSLSCGLDATMTTTVLAVRSVVSGGVVRAGTFVVELVLCAVAAMFRLPASLEFRLRSFLQTWVASVVPIDVRVAHAGETPAIDVQMFNVRRSTSGVFRDQFAQSAISNFGVPFCKVRDGRSPIFDVKYVQHRSSNAG